MVLKALTRLFGESNQKALDQIKPLVEEINSIEQDFHALSDDELRSTTAELRERYAGGESLDDLLPEAFAVVREASMRSIGLRHFDMQLLGGVVLHEGKIAEMRTGEGKTLVATLPVYLNALTGESVHVVTVNDYLAKRDAGWMGGVYHALGITVGCLQNDGSWVYDPEAASETEGGNGAKPSGEPFRAATKQEAYLTDVTYGTNNEFGFDYLRDNMVDEQARMVQRGLAYAIVDEVDNILIDEARTPLIISGPAPDKGQEYARYANIAKQLTEEQDFTIDLRTRGISLSLEGITRVERQLNVSNLYDPANYEMTHYVENAVRAEAVYLRDRDYVLRDGEVLIVDEHTGRLMTGRRYSEGLHQAIEAKEGVRVQRESVTYATITLQNYFRMYGKLAGMTGTAVTEAEELHKIYSVEVVEIPTNVEMVRDDLPDLIYKMEKAKFAAAVNKIEELVEEGRPVLVGTASIEKSEHLSEMLTKRGVDHEVLNAKNHAREATIIAQAGRPGAVTVSTNMAGRGTDIILGGNPDQLDIPYDEWEADHQKVIELGGLFVLGTERHDARRIDNQLRGRAGRQGDPGVSRFFISTEDDLVRRFGGDRIRSVMNLAGLEDDAPIEHGMISKAVESAQTKVEGYHFEIRKHLVDYDDVINTHRDVIYKLRQRVVRQESVRDTIMEMSEKSVRELVADRLVGPPDTWDVEAFQQELRNILPVLPLEIQQPDQVVEYESAELEELLIDEVKRVHEQRVEQFGDEVMATIERHVLLRYIDSHWVNHLTAIENMRQGIGLQAVGQRDPLVQYKHTAYEMFGELMANIDHDVSHTIYRVAPAQNMGVAADRSASASGLRGAETTAGRRGAPAETRPPAGAARGRSALANVAAAHGGDGRVGKRKIGRNDPCYCGSGKKYKRCHGRS